jgi:SAM-dependent methyltransferase
MQTAYDQIAERYATVNADMPPETLAAAERFLGLVESNARILDLGCGPGRDMAWFEAQGAVVVGVDLSPGMLAQARLQACGPLVQMDMRRLAFQTGTFRGIWCNAALLHLPKRETPAALAQMRRVLAPGGALSLSIQEGAEEIWERDPYCGVVERFFARYSEAEMLALLEDIGFTIQEHIFNQGKARRWLRFLAMPAAS